MAKFDPRPVLYQSKDGKMEKTFDALEWLAKNPNKVVFGTKAVQGVSGTCQTLCFLGVQGSMRLRPLSFSKEWVTKFYPS
jgi:hypothetical protein